MEDRGGREGKNILEESSSELAQRVEISGGFCGVYSERENKKARYTVTAYCHCAKCCGKSNGITASGARAIEGVTIAADTKVLPFGTKVIIDGNTYTVQDRGGAIKGNRIDIYFNTHEKALQYGRQTKEVTILKGD